MYVCVCKWGSTYKTPAWQLREHDLNDNNNKVCLH